MTKKVILLAALLVLLPSLALATPVTFSTTGVVSGPVPITFTGVVNQNAPFTPFVSPIGNFAFNCSGACSGTDTFTITIAQSVPGVGTGVLTATLSGIIAFNQNGTGTLTFGAPTIIVAGGEATQYAGINFVLTANGVPLLATITQTNVPEPNAELLLGLGGLGLLGLTTISRKKVVNC